MSKIRLAIYRPVTDRVLAVIQKLGVIEFTQIPFKEADLSQWEPETFSLSYKTASLENAVELLRQYTKHPVIKSALEGLKEPVTENEIEQIVNHFSAEPILNQISHWETNLNRLEAETKALTEQKYELWPWENWNKSLDKPRKTRYTVEITAQGSTSDRDELVDRLADLKTPVAWETVGEKAIAIYCLKKDEDQILNQIKEFNLDIITLPVMPGRVSDALERIERDLEIITHHRAAIDEELTGLSRYLPELQVLADYYKWQKDCHDIQSTAGFSHKAVFFEGWCPTESIKTIKKAISKITPRFDLEEINSDHEPPLEIRNHSLIEPFESVTRLYGMPGSKDLDPTLFLAGFFFLFFGLSLTDVGYGLILAGLSAWLIYWYRLPKATKSLVALMLLGGISSILIGLAFGGFFGLDTGNWPAWLQAWQIFDPIDNPLPIFYLVLALGVCQIIAGLILAIVRDVQNKKPMQGWLDNGPWLLAFGVIGLHGLNTLGWLNWPEMLLISLTVIVVAFLVITQGRHESHWLSKLGKGILSLYGFVGYLSDILSYSRLLALGLATTALAFSVNMIAELAIEIIPIGGAVVAGIIVFLGHGFTIIVNVLGAFVHSARLQFVEFFKGFLTGAGRPFHPFNRDERYISLENNKI